MEAPTVDQKWLLLYSKLSLANDQCSHLVHHAGPFFKFGKWRRNSTFWFSFINFDHSATETPPHPLAPLNVSTKIFFTSYYFLCVQV